MVVTHASRTAAFLSFQVKLFKRKIETLFFIVISFKSLHFTLCSNIRNFIRYLSSENDKRNVAGVTMFALSKNFISKYVQLKCKAIYLSGCTSVLFRIFLLVLLYIHITNTIVYKLKKFCFVLILGLSQNRFTTALQHDRKHSRRYDLIERGSCTY